MIKEILILWAGLRLGSEIADIVTKMPIQRIRNKKKPRKAAFGNAEKIKRSCRPYCLDNKDPAEWTKRELVMVKSFLNI